MKIVVLGASNSILLDGWLPTFSRADKTHEIVNISIGGSRSPAMLHSFLENLDRVADADLAIVEPTVLDCGELAGNGDEVAGQASALLRVLLEKGVTPVVLVLPRLPRHIDNPSPGMLAWAGIASNLGVSVFNGAHVIKVMADSQSKDYSEMWRDNYGHHIPAAGQMIGKVLSRFVQDKHVNPPAYERMPSGESLPWRVVSGRDLAATSNLPSRKSSTALVSIECAVMVAGDTLRCDIGPDEKILGIAINYGEMNPSTPILIDVVGQSSSLRLNLSHNLLPPTVTHITRLLFRPSSSAVGAGSISFPLCAENMRFAADGVERLEISALLVGTEILPLTTWVNVGSAALTQSHDVIESIFADIPK